jgi:cellulose synthase/poly-beta-1,6-N-acetylglucosamine synthase-like glycosyltransferase
MVPGLCVITLILLSLIVAYQWALALAAIGRRPARTALGRRQSTKFHVLIPAHNEQSGLSSTLQSLMRVRYPKELLDVTVVADRCDDDTAVVARNHGVACLERRNGQPGKGATIAWAINELRNSGAVFDALVILDADTIADPTLLEAFDEGLSSGQPVQQAYNYLSNPWETPFTRLIAVTSTLRNSLFYGGKARIGLSGMLTGTGMCFSSATIACYGWTALSVGEDWEFSASLLLHSVKIYFNPNARVFARESAGLKQASTQRLRWASGRYAVAARTASKLCAAGIRLRRVYLVDAALTLVIPTYSAQAVLAVLALVGAWLVSDLLLAWAALVIGSLSAYFLLGVVLTDSPRKTVMGIALIPVFLPWRIAIEILGLLGYGRKRWVRTDRLSPIRHKAGQ